MPVPPEQQLRSDPAAAGEADALLLIFEAQGVRLGFDPAQKAQLGGKRPKTRNPAVPIGATR